MPRNRRPQDREEKRGEIVAAATRLFVDEGYEPTTVARIGREAGVTSNTVYWYFKDKDEVLVAVLDALFAQFLAGVAERSAEPPVEQLLWAVTELRRVDRLITTVHARVAASESLRVWHDSFHAQVEAILRWHLAALGVPETEQDAMTRIGVFVVEGMLTHANDAAGDRGVVEALVRSARGIAAVAGSPDGRSATG
ncbi:TetR/AcrR family transcriptional regulator [Amycolatopsis sp. Hca4]|uniref:TetR/AcrR family transcriptional regulator n=1 Tax=Amycolatopsis sp. Hca4 TaxID=2742131 RepID=UPI00159287CA|nr:TetR/AcrR family transcriptional regulator [Amycolatopsis sp. Hca4]QKV78496.1 TetR/AcrR family transcriptional regulator [Amycolatopsis sp. Hca4]